MSHGQIERLAINANNGVAEKGGIVIATETGNVTLNSVGNVALKINSTPINNELRYHAVTPVTSQSPIVSNVAPAINATIQHGSSPSGHLIHLIPLQMGNKTITATAPLANSKAQQVITDIPLTIITKGVQANTTQTSSIATIGEPTNITAVIGTLSNKAYISDAFDINSINVATTNDVLGSTTSQNSTNMSAGENAVSSNSDLNLSSTSIVQNQTLKAKTSLQHETRVPEVVSSVVLTNHDKNVTTKFSVNGNLSTAASTLVSKGFPPSHNPSKLLEDNNIEKNKTLNFVQESLPSFTKEKFEKIVLLDQAPIAGKVSEIVSVAPSGTALGSDDTNVSAQNKTSKEVISGSFLTENPKITGIPKNNRENSHYLQSDIVTEDLDKSATMLIIDDSTDDENQDDVDCEDTMESKTQTSSTAVTHISNSVVLTKAKTVDTKTNGSSRNLQDEPANVVLMKLPNAVQQESGTMKPSVEIPITEALTLATSSNPTRQNTIKIVPTEKLLACSQKEQQPLILMRSTSIPNANKSLSPRATKRSQSLNSGCPQKLSLGHSSIVASKNVELKENRRHSNPVKFITVYPTNSGSSSEKVDEQVDSLSSSDELDKENNKISFIELEDSFEEDFSDGSNEAVNNNKHEQDKSNTAGEEKPENLLIGDQMSSKPNHINSKEERRFKDKICMETSIVKDQNANMKSYSMGTASPSSTLHNNKMISNSKRKVSSEKNENDDQIIKSLLCNENIISMASSSSSSASSLQEPSSFILQSNARAALAPRARDQNKIVDANASTARRICRDSSIASALSMVSTFDMLNWKEDRIASARGTNMRFELNEFNLLQLHERGCPPRYRIHTPYERPIYERYDSTKKSDQGDPLLYLCRKCKLYGPAVDFLAPEFCSVDCLKRTSGKRGLREVDAFDGIEMKKPRKNASLLGTSKPASCSNGATKQAPIFHWSSYLSNIRNAVAAPIDLFLNPFPTGPNPFQVGMKVEAIDPENCSLFCVCTIVRIQGYRLRLNFDGYNSVYDFWVNADSMDIFPPGWCGKTNRILQPPRGHDPNKFDWATYLRKTNSIGADKKFFTHLNSGSVTNRNPFTIGMFLEADDLNDTGKLCVASVADVLDERIRVHFDGWDDCYDYWVDISSPYIHPCGWHEGRQQLLVPPEYSNTSFNWRDYIRESQGIAAPTDFFVSRDPIDYRPGMKLEVVDPRNPSLIRPATIVHRTRHRVKIHLDCWPLAYIFSLEDDSPDLHPIGWCDATGHELEPPPGFHQQPKVMPCSTQGCRGLGNMDRSNGLTHANREFCPYILENWRAKPEKSPRIDSKDIVRNVRNSTASLLRNVNRNHNHTNEMQIPVEKLSRRGRLRNNDRLYTNNTSSSSTQQSSRQQSLDLDSIKVEIVNEDTEEIKLESDVVKNLDSLIRSPHSSTQTSSPVVENVTFKIAKRFLCDYGPRLQQNYVLWYQNTSIDIASKVKSNPLLWSTAETCAFIDAVLRESQYNAERYAVSSKFYKHDIDGVALLMLQQKDLIEILQFKIGPAVKICAIILQLRMLVVSKYGSSISTVETVNQKVTKVKNISDLSK